MRITFWKALGLAGLAGVAATGVVTARAERRRRTYTPDEIRARLHERVETGVMEPQRRFPAPKTCVVAP